MNSLVGIGLGSNVGDRAQYLAQARKALGFEEMLISSLYESAALLPQDAREEWDAPYLNQVVVARVEVLPEPRALLAHVKEIERKLGRQARGHWGPREIDIDLLFLGDVVMQTPELVLPHAQMHLRNFVMLPLAEILPEWEHPVVKTQAYILSEGLPNEGITRYEC